MTEGYAAVTIVALRTPGGSIPPVAPKIIFIL